MIIPAPPGKEYQRHQLSAIRYAMGARGTIFADDMGLGKTVQAIGVINASPYAQRVLVICPAFLRLTWQREWNEWRVNGVQSIQFASYHEVDDLAKSTDLRWDILIVDEAHYIKNPKSQRGQNVEAIAERSDRVLLLTGTPMENRPIELWQLLKIACPEKWSANPRIRFPDYVRAPERKQWSKEGPGFWAFAERYCGLRYVTKDMGHGRTKKTLDFGGASNLEELNARLKNTCMVRRLKRDVLHDLPDIRRQLIVLESNANDSDMFPNLDDDSYFDVLAKLTADKVAFSEWSRRRHEQALAKVDDSLRFIGDQLDGSAKIIVFAHHRDVVEKLVMGLQCEVASDERVVSMTGDMQMLARQIAADAFQNDPKVRVIVGTLGCMGVGWTLTAADHVICVELDPVPGRMSQAESRPHRIGQKNAVLVQHLVSNGSLCARMAQILVRKQVILSKALDAGNATLVYAESSENDPLP